MSHAGVLMLSAVILLAACGSLQVGQNGPIQVILGPLERIEAICSALAHRRAVGCLVPERHPTQEGLWHWTIWCPFNDPVCLSHEIRHLIEPEWSHL